MQTILNQESRLRILQMPATYAKDAKGEYLRHPVSGDVQVLAPGKQILLQPGANFVEEADWAILKKQEPVLKLVELTHLKEGPKVAEVETALRALSNVEAIKLVVETYDLDLLVAWKNTDKRTAILASIETQIAKCNGVTTDKSSK